ncbi:GNAT family acetyltransferase [Hoeflea prorocentri]|uniref:GNAT family acetyltransferase n=1 Tax=Hoeflea prorocentri TaxID=1922333 RepID=A0A9X3ZHW3_9HYPH|nr:GNAT family acetyltransferase [Hoeflea prorocentri]MCY6382257.1 GNAT family acetyltransferase [Hoeflea prorocentri]MDA5400057.1 GNAT family acetyltransferase [Hoeflea prorocentri]
MKIRDVVDADVEQIIDLWARAGVTRPWNDPLQDISFCRKGDSSTLLVLVEEALVTGTAMVGEDGHRGWVYYVAVDPSRQGDGLGKLIMSAAESWLRERGIWKVNILVRHDNSAVREFYEALGYADTQAACYQKRLEADPPHRQDG